jgi:cell division initiation protein
MERLTPLDLQKAQFQTSFRGFDRAEVKNVLDRAAEEIARLLEEQKALKERQALDEQELERFRAQESTLKEALLLAQKTADQTRAAAHKEADRIMAEAQRKAEEIAEAARRRVSDMRWELERLSLERSKFETRFRTLLEEYLRGLDQPRGQEPVLIAVDEEPAETSA